jgi:DNA invertase Pin-like site-specific DNA recombinase
MKPLRPLPAAKRRCAIYTRKSTTHGLEQEFSSLDAQWEACAAYVKAQPGWELVSERYDDGGFTGANLERPAFRRLLADVMAGRVDVVVVYKIDRLSRSLLDFANLMERFRKAGAFFVSVTQPFLSADSDAMAQLLLNVLMAFAQFERQMIAERIRDKVVASRRKGLWTGGHVPFGYAVRDKKLVPVPAEAEVVRRAFALYAEHRSDAAVVRLLGASGARTRGGKPFSTPGIIRLLENPVYAGLVRLGEAAHAGSHEPIVSREAFEAVQAERHKPRPRREAVRNPDYVLRGLAFCVTPGTRGQACGCALTPASTRKGRKVFRYYRCSAKNKLGPSACSASQVSALELEGAVRRRIAEVARAVHGDGGVEAELRARLVEQREALQRECFALRERLAAAAASAKAGRRRKADDPERLHAELTRATERLAVLENLTLDAKWIAGALADFDSVWERLHPVNRVRLVQSVVRRVEVDSASKDIRIELQPWCQALVEGEAERGAA